MVGHLLYAIMHVSRGSCYEFKVQRCNNLLLSSSLKPYEHAEGH